MKSPLSYSKELEEIYKKPAYAVLSTSKFVEKVRKSHPHIPTKQIKEFVENQTLQQTYTTQKFKGYYKIVAPPKTFQIDIFFKHEKPFLIFVDILSRKVFIEKLKSRNIDVIIEGIENILDRCGGANGIESDDEFNKETIRTLLEGKDIQFSSVVSKTEHLSKGNKLGIVDTAVRTIKKLINKYMDLTDDAKFENAIGEILDIYNTTPHSSLKGNTPEEAYTDIKLQAQLYKDAQEANTKLENSIDLDIGDYVRKSLDKSKFEKEKQTYTKTVYVIHDIVGKKYQLMDASGEVDDRLYKYSQLLKIDPNKVKVFSLYETLSKVYRRKPKRTHDDNEDPEESKVDEARRIYKKAKRTMRQLKKEGIEADTLMLTKKRKGDTIIEEESIGERVVKRRVVKSVKKRTSGEAETIAERVSKRRGA
jgi:tetratricopeptide (TPR) repeat protein